MLDLATRVYDHNFRIDPIVRSLLDTDFYKVLMAQTIFRRHRDLPVTFGIKNRSTAIRVADETDETDEFPPPPFAQRQRVVRSIGGVGEG